MTSKKLQEKLEAVERARAKLAQDSCNLDRKETALGMDIRKARVAQFCQIGGDAEAAGLREMDRQVRMGAFLLLREQLKSEDFIQACRERAELEMKRRTGKEPAVELGSDAAAVPPEKSRETESPIPEQVGADEEGERLVVRFNGPISGLGRELRSLGLEYNRDQQRWSGTTVRAEVIRVIEASRCAHLLESIEPAVWAKSDHQGIIDPAAYVSADSARSAAEPDVDVEFEVDLTEVDERSPAEIWRASILGASGGTSR